jgi:hypothetical protein
VELTNAKASSQQLDTDDQLNEDSLHAGLSDILAFLVVETAERRHNLMVHSPSSRSGRPCGAWPGRSSPLADGEVEGGAPPAAPGSSASSRSPAGPSVDRIGASMSRTPAMPQRSAALATRSWITSFTAPSLSLACAPGGRFAVWPRWRGGPHHRTGQFTFTSLRRSFRIAGVNYKIHL